MKPEHNSPIQCRTQLQLSTCESAESAIFPLCALRKREESSDYLNFHFILHLRAKRGQEKGNEVWKRWKNSSSKPLTGLIQCERSSKSPE